MNSFNLSCIVVAIILVGCGDSVPNIHPQGYPATGVQQQYQQPAGQPVHKILQMQELCSDISLKTFKVKHYYTTFSPT